MAAFLVVLIIVIGVVLLARSRSARPRAESKRLTPLARPVGTMSPVFASVTPAAPSNALQPFSPIPLTVEGASTESIRALRSILDDERTHGRARRDRIMEWLLTTNARVVEIDRFIDEWGPKFKAVAKALAEADPDWSTAGELDRDDILDGASRKAAEGFDVRVPELKYEVIADRPTMVASADDELLARYGLEIISFYFQNANALDQIHIAPSDDWYRPRFEALVAKGLARRGTDIPAQAALQQLSLKQMEEVAEGVEHKRFTRRAPAVGFLATLPDLRERLADRVSFREMFQLLPLPPVFAHLDLGRLSHAWSFAGEYAALLESTYATATQAHEAASRAVIDEYARGWSVEFNYGDQACCPLCSRQGGERRSAKAPPSLPHHVGCRCYLSQVYG